MEPPDQAIARLEAERDQLKDRYLRLAAEYENFKKRTAKERAEAWVRAQAELVTRLADALDDLSRFAHVDPATTDAQTLHEGVDLVERKMWKELAALGVTRIDATGVHSTPTSTRPSRRSRPGPPTRIIRWAGAAGGLQTR